VLVACGGPKLASLQSSCEQRYADFPNQTRCLKREALAADPQLSRPGGDLVRLYLAYGDAAAARVEDGTMREVDARLAMAELYSRIKAQADARQADQQARYSQFL